MDWDNEQICHWLTAVGLGEYVQLFRGMFVKLGITGKESSAFVFPFGEGKRVFNGSKQKLRTVYFYILGGGHFKYLYLCGGTPKIIKILVVVPQIIDRVPTSPQVFFPGKALSQSQPNFAEMILGWSPSKIVSGNSDLRPRWLPQQNLI
jgi:hypothetical protein